MLKHRKRKEKGRPQAGFDGRQPPWLTDLTTERRQLKPLGKQAGMARRAAAIHQADLRDTGATGGRRPGAAPDRFESTNQAETLTVANTVRVTAGSEAASVRLEAHPSRPSPTCRSLGRNRSADLVPGVGAGRKRVRRDRADRDRPGATLFDTEPEMSSGRDPDELDAEAEQVAELEQQLLDRTRRIPRSARSGA